MRLSLRIGLALVMSGLADAQACERLDYERSFDEANAFLGAGKAAEARRVLEEGFNRLTESCDPVPPDVIGRLAYVLGAYALEVGDDEAAERWFTHHAVMVGHLPPPAGLGPEKTKRYNEVLVQASARGRGGFAASKETVWVDGAPLGTTPREVVVGVHLLQWGTPGALSGRWQQAESGLTLCLPEDAVCVEPDPDPWLGYALAGGGVVATVAGAGLFVGVNRGPTWHDQCRTGTGPVREPIEASWAGYRECGTLTGVPVLLGTVSAISLMSLGGAAFGAGAAVVGIQVLPGGLGVSGRF